MKRLVTLSLCVVSLPVAAEDLLTVACERVTGDIPEYNEFTVDLDREYVSDNLVPGDNCGE
jgi:hypothetical protein